MLARKYAEFVHDDIVELFFNLGMVFSANRQENLAVFRELHAIVWDRMTQLEGMVRDDLCCECAGMLVEQRELMHLRLVPSAS